MEATFCITGKSVKAFKSGWLFVSPRETLPSAGTSELLLAGLLDKLIQTPWKPVKAHFSNWPLSLGFAGQGIPLPWQPVTSLLCPGALANSHHTEIAFFPPLPTAQNILLKAEMCQSAEGGGSCWQGAPLPDLCQPSSHPCPFTPLAHGSVPCCWLCCCWIVAGGSGLCWWESLQPG